MKDIVSLLKKILCPLGFKRNGQSFLRYQEPLLLRVSAYGSQWDEIAFIDVCLTYSEVPIFKQSAGDWHALIRIERLLPSGPQIRYQLKKKLNEQERATVSRILEAELPNAIMSLTDVSGVIRSLQSNPQWLVKDFLNRKLAGHGANI